MASILDLSLLASFSSLYAFLFIFAIMYALLQKTKWISEGSSINALIAVLAGIMALLSSSMLQLINFIVPWFAVAIIFFTLMILLFMVFGAKGDTIAKAVNDKTLMWTLIGIGIIIVVAGLGSIWGQSFAEASSGDGTATNATSSEGAGTSSSFNQNIYTIVFNPKVMGFGIMFIIIIFAVALLSGSPS